ncbi:MAG: type II toxin-antitoxin system RelB/DinJ family antitoxin [Patescibacteria group bacterium]
MANPITNIRLDPKLKKQIERIAREMGVTLADIVRMALHAIASGRWHVGPTEYPPAYVDMILKETENMRRLRKEGKLKGYTSGKEMIDDILSE